MDKLLEARMKLKIARQQQAAAQRWHVTQLCPRAKLHPLDCIGLL